MKIRRFEELECLALWNKRMDIPQGEEGSSYKGQKRRCVQSSGESF